MATHRSLRRHPGLRWFNIPLFVASIAGTVVIVALALGFYTWWAFAISGVVGIVLGVPLGIWVTNAIKRAGSAWPPERLG